MKTPRFRQAVPQDEYRPFPWMLIRDFALGALTLIGFLAFWLFILTSGKP